MALTGSTALMSGLLTGSSSGGDRNAIGTGSPCWGLSPPPTAPFSEDACVAGDTNYLSILIS